MTGFSSTALALLALLALLDLDLDFDLALLVDLDDFADFAAYNLVVSRLMIGVDVRAQDLPPRLHDGVKEVMIEMFDRRKKRPMFIVYLQ